MQLFTETLQGMVVPRRMIPIAVVCIPMIVLEWHFTGADGVVLALMIFGGFLLVGPVSYRLFFPVRERLNHKIVRGVAFLAVDLTYTAVFGFLLPRWMNVHGSILTDPLTLYSAPPLFWAGSWALGRDMDWEVDLARAKVRYETLEREAQRAQLLALRSHMDPHFLFNTLNAIAEWCRDDPAVAERATLQLSSMLRTMLTGVKAPTWPLKQEFELSRQLLELHHWRDPDRFNFTVIEDENGISVPVAPLILLPIVENAIKHGPAAGHKGSITLRSALVGDRLEVTVSNPGDYNGRREGGEGIQMVENRLKLAYEGDASMEFLSASQITTVRLRLPLTPRGEAV